MLLRIDALPADPLEAAARFFAEVLPTVSSALPHGNGDGEDLLLIFPSADHTHRAWRLAVVQELARKYAPVRINATASDDEDAIAAAAAYLAGAPGVTGQLLLLDGNGAGEVLSSSS
jgi:hypothetical protein